MIKTSLFRFIFFILVGGLLQAQVVQKGSGSYTTNFPGTDAAGRNGFPSGTPYVTGAAALKPVPTNEWWSHKVKNAHSSNLFNYPFTLKTVNAGLVATYIPWGPIDNIEPVQMGLTGLNASSVKIADHDDWMITMDWQNGNRHMQVKTGIGMPFLYFNKDSASVAELVVNQGTVTDSGSFLIIKGVRNGADFVVYGPSGSSWQKNGNTYTSSLNAKNYWSLAFIPPGGNIDQKAADLKKYAFVFPKKCQADYQYNEQSATVRTDFHIDTEIMEGSDSLFLQGLLPHHWSKLATGSAVNTSHSFSTVRGDLKLMAANDFATEATFYGILPTLPNVNCRSASYDPGLLKEKIDLLKNEGLATWTDSYNEGQSMNRLIQTARIAEQIGDTAALNSLLKTVKERLEDWLSYQSGEVAFLFYYNQTWDALIGYPAGHGQDVNINDHHFHWGYFIHAAAFMEQYEPGWAANWGPMINMLVRDAASSNRQDSHFPYLRNFSPFAGHCWANGFASFPQGNDQESTSESMQFNSALIHWGEVTGNDSIRDLGIYLYTTEQAAVEEYWFDKNQRNFGPNQQYSLVSRVWGNSYDNGTFWTSDIAASYGIELYPIHGGSLYLGHDQSYATSLWAEIEQNTGILNNTPNVNLWHDVMWQYLAFTDPDKALNLYDSYPNRALKFGVSDAQTYYWLHSMKVLGGAPDLTVTSNHPLATAFQGDGNRVYVAQNYSNSPLTVQYSDGYQLSVPAGELVSSLDADLEG
ncbi:MAG: glycosyl hydrolase, partial [Croceimicrobium sp.]